ncbi:MAG: acetyltransferase [Cohaesibacter sp.]|jgi:sugar O-acyltransferase (sialic acid O-acetyltransferase NeuD family)|nr:acetyltransferase [Cohaesibacter sp.]
MHQILIFGGKFKAKIMVELIREHNLGSIAAIYDPNLDHLDFDTDVPFINSPGPLLEILPNCSHVVPGIGGEHGLARYMCAQYFNQVGLKSLNIIHHRACVETQTMLGVGSQIMAGAVLNKFSSLGDHCILNTNAVVDHDCTLGNGVHIMGGAAVAGNVSIGDFATVGTNATLLPGLTIGKGAYIGAGAVVLQDVPDFAVMVGNPSRYLRDNNLVFDPKPYLQLGMTKISTKSTRLFI